MNKMWKVQNVLDYLNKRLRGSVLPLSRTVHRRNDAEIQGAIEYQAVHKDKADQVWRDVKIFTLAEAKTGYVLNLLPYAGKREDTGVGKTTQTVHSMSASTT